MQRLIRFIYTEQQYFIEELKGNLEKVFYSNLFHIISNPLFGIFINAFIWRTTGSLLNVVLYSAGDFLCLPIAFFLNGFLLGKVNIRTAYWIGTLVASLTTALVVFLGVTSPYAFLAYGCLVGLGNGFYWANRNYLELQESNPNQRKYFYSLLSIADRLANIVVPLFAGWFIIFGQNSNFYSPVHAYWILFGTAIVLMLGGALTIARGSFESPVPLFISRLKIKPFLNKRRILSLAQGLTDGLGFVPTILILLFLGKEGVLGTIAAIISVVTIVIIYLYGRIANGIDPRRVLLISTIGFSLCALYLALSPGPISSIVYILLTAIFLNFMNLAVSPLLLSLTDIEMGDNPSTHRYSFIFDNELFLNIGRLISFAFILICIFSGQITHALFYISLFAGIVQIILIRIFLKLTQ